MSPVSTHSLPTHEFKIVWCIIVIDTLIIWPWRWGCDLSARCTMCLFNNTHQYNNDSEDGKLHCAGVWLQLMVLKTANVLYTNCAIDQYRLQHIVSSYSR